MSDQSTMATRIQKARIRAGMSQTALADQMVALGRSTWRQTTVSRAEQGTRTLTYADVRALDRILSTSIASGLTPDISPEHPADRTAQVVRSLRECINTAQALLDELETP